MIQFTLEEIITQDNLVHQGLLHVPPQASGKVLVWIHGLTGTFYSNAKSMNGFAEEAAKHGMAFAAFHTRGHDYVTSTHKIDPNSPKGYVHEMIGAGVENFTDCVKDIDAIVSFLAGKELTKVILIGHSTGANKVCYYAGTVTDNRLAGVVLSGPMSDRYSATDPETNKKHRAIMEQKINEGKGDELLTGFDFFPLTPKRWMSLLAEGSPEDVFNYHDEQGALATYARITVPLLVMFGGSDEHADRPVPEMQKAFDAHAKSSKYKSVVVPDADHGFTGKEKVFVDEVVAFAASL
ncbi:MAG: alpha/beta hydrolase [Patescibacteria group bacterium]